jgi:hypothetical protein
LAHDVDPGSIGMAAIEEVAGPRCDIGKTPFTRLSAKSLSGQFCRLERPHAGWSSD